MAKCGAHPCDNRGVAPTTDGRRRSSRSGKSGRKDPKWLDRPLFDGSREAWKRRYQKNLDAWQQEEARWQKMGVWPDGRRGLRPRRLVERPREIGGVVELHGEITQVVEVLRKSCHARERYEERYRDAVRARHRRPARDAGLSLREWRRRRRAIRDVLEILETDRNQNGRLLWRSPADETTRAQLRAMLSKLSPPPPRPRQHLGEVWVRPFVEQLARIFSRDGVSRAEVVDAVYDALGLAGHHDVITREIIRHIFRAKWRATSNRSLDRADNGRQL